MASLKVLTCPFSSRHQASVEHRREMAPIPDTPQKPQSHPVVRESQEAIGGGGGGHPVDWKHGFTPLLDVVYRLHFVPEAFR